MAHRDGFWKLAHLSDAQLLASLGGVLRTQQRALADLVAHLGEVEERRLHLEAAYSSMFAYCVLRLGMSEDEACRRIALARLARRFPAFFGELASGQITLSVALLLEPAMTPNNHLELLGAVRGKCIRQARELVAARFPKPDAPSSIRKLPERRPAEAADVEQARLSVPSLSSCPTATPVAATHAHDSSTTAFAVFSSTPEPESPNVRSASSSMPGVSIDVAAPRSASCPEPMSVAAAREAPTTVISSRGASHAPMANMPVTLSATPDLPLPDISTPSLAIPMVSSPSPAAAVSSAPCAPALSMAIVDPQARASTPRIPPAPVASRGVFEPLSAERYRIQFTADLALEKKLELARDLLRHSHPSGDFAPIVSQALDLLLDDLLRRHFGAGAPRKTCQRHAERNSGGAARGINFESPIRWLGVGKPSAHAARGINFESPIRSRDSGKRGAHAGINAASARCGFGVGKRGP